MNDRYAQRRKWQRELSAYWVANPQTSCEVKFACCVGNFGLGPAHAQKRRYIQTKQDFFTVAAACQTCHETLDNKMSHEEMEQTVLKIVESRGFTCKTCGDAVPPPLEKCSACELVFSAQVV